MPANRVIRFAPIDQLGIALEFAVSYAVGEFHMRATCVNSITKEVTLWWPDGRGRAKHASDEWMLPRRTFATARRAIAYAEHEAHGEPERRQVILKRLARRSNKPRLRAKQKAAP